MGTEAGRTDRSYVVVNKMFDGGYRVEICQSGSAEGQADNVYAENVGVPEIVTELPNSLGESGAVAILDGAA